MKSKIFKIFFIFSLLASSLLISGTAYAQDEELPDPGITPDSPFYFFDKLGKNIGMFFAFGPEAKANKALEYAEERLAEARAMATANRTREMTRAANDYEGYMAMVNEREEELSQLGNSANISERVALAVSRHFLVLDDLEDRVPEQAKEAIIKARTASMNGHENALRALARIKPERALEINAEAIEGRLLRARILAADNVTSEVEEALANAANLTEIEEEISDIARALGKDISSIQERLAQSTSNRFEILSEVYEQVPEHSKPAVADALENSVDRYEGVIERIRERYNSGEIPEETEALEKAREELRERLQIMTSNTAQVSNNSPDSSMNQENTSAQVRENVREPELSIEFDVSEPDASGNMTRENNENSAQENTRKKGP